jgi:translation initiation factor IF-1
MAHADQIEAPARIVEVLGRGAYRAELANGHVCLARAAVGEASVFAVGDPVQLAFHPADLSRARIKKGAA